jgi:hypothetical protein
MDQVEKRVEKLEAWQAQTNTEIALVKADVKTMKKQLGKIENNTTWVLRLVTGAIILGVLAYVFQIPV